MRGLTVVLGGAEASRLDAALTLVNAVAALGGRARLYLHDAAVTVETAGPLAEAAIDLGVEIIACQSALDRYAAALPAGATGGGMVGLLGSLGEDRLLFV